MKIKEWRRGKSKKYVRKQLVVKSKIKIKDINRMSIFLLKLLFGHFFKFVRRGLKWRKILLLRGNSGRINIGVLVMSNTNVRISKKELVKLRSN